MKTSLTLFASFALGIAAQAQEWNYDRYGRKESYSEPRHKESTSEAIQRERQAQTWHHDSPFTNDNPYRKHYDKHQHVIVVPR